MGGFVHRGFESPSPLVALGRVQGLGNARPGKRGLSSSGRASDEELGYVTTDDSFSKILEDAASRLGTWLSEAESQMSDRAAAAQQHPARQRVANLIEELERRLRRDPTD